MMPCLALRTSRNRERRDRGAAAVEFALVLPVLMTLLLGIIQVGWYFFVANSASSGAREAGRRIVVGDCWGSTDLLNFVKAQAPTATAASYAPTDLSAEDVGKQITITVTADASIISFIPGFPSTVERQFSARLEDKSGSCS